MMRPRREGGPAATEVEWKWLTAAPDCNPFIGFVDNGRLTTWARLAELWREHEAEIRQLWATEGEPAKLPHGHPAAQDPDVAH